jgi:hypothetical protein
MDNRNQAEENMFHYGSGVGQARSDNTKALRSAAARVRNLGIRDAETFAGSMRPRYCTLNYAQLKDGMGAQWGRSHIVLADHLKPNLTFVSSDSFDFAIGTRATPKTSQAQVATYTRMTRLICHMAESMLDGLVDSAVGFYAAGHTSADFKKTYALGDTAYIEAHCHAEIFFRRDVRKFRICSEEVSTCEQTYAKQKVPWDPISPATLRSHILNFAAQNMVEIEWFD